MNKMTLFATACLLPASSNGPLRGQKGDVFEGGHRVPAIAWWPGRISAGVVAQDTAMTMDLMPTYLELAKANLPGLENSSTLDGKTLAPVLFEGQPTLTKAPPSTTRFPMKPLFRTISRGEYPNRLKSDFLSIDFCIKYWS